MEISVGSEIRITDYPLSFLQMMEKELIVPNPEYIKNQRLGYSCYKVPKNLQLFKKVGNTLVLPFGKIGEVQIYQLFDDVDFSCEFPQGKDFGGRVKFEPYDYQREAIEDMEQFKNGVVVAPCGSGKTNIALSFIAQHGQRALWITHTQDLLKQSLERAKNILDFDSDKPYGIISEGKVDIGECITFATVQTLSKINLDSIRDYWNVIIVDECHHAVQSVKSTAMFAKVMNQLKARYKIGLTATPYRADKLEVGMFALLGNIIHTVPEEVTQCRTVPFREHLTDVAYTPDYSKVFNGDGTLNHSALISDLVADENRNKIIADEIAGAEGTSLVLSDRVKHLHYLEELVGDRKKCIVIKATGNKKEKQERNEALDKLNKKEIDVVLATYQLAKEGLDVPTLNNLFFASPTDNKAVVIQATGRVIRKAEGKEYGTVYDYIDSFRPFYRKARNRINIRKKMQKSL